ncbi:hypothetical protein FYJ38_00025 [Clostridium sp. WB02_MRS01]|uniref:hypothetical protein n=1 Tax=Clostridium sp. WB02_MRS01 TaxID=2605777 RepID=UPI0012B362D9|nr:hypothetical protein [Clostridium sp. WB02_MRS01]MSS07026.1 hypothetical protein [Clostridium sp. WB02_MRS01]
MIKVKDVDSKWSPRKKNITIENIRVDGDKFVDEEGSIADRLLDALPSGKDTQFTIKISIELPDEEDEVDLSDDEE